MLIFEVSPICIALQETMLGNSPCLCPREYTAYHSPYDVNIGSHGGVALYVRADTPHNHYVIQSPLQAVAVQVHLERKYTLCSIYLPPNEAFPRDEFKSLIQQLPRPFLILGDMNSRSPLWGDVITNQRGNCLSSIIEGESVGVLNTGESTHFHVQTGTLSAIDLSISSDDCTIDFGWKVINDRFTSDHFPIIVTTSTGPPSPRLPRWNTRRADWTTFREESSIDDSADDFPSIDDAIDFLVTILFSAGLQSIPRCSGIFKRRPVPWWTDKCYEAHRTMRAAFTRYRRRRCEYYLVEFRKARARFRFIIKKARKDSWKIFIASINSKTPISVVWKKVRKISGKFAPSNPPVLKINGVNVADPQLVANEFAKHFSHVSKKGGDRPFARYRERMEQGGINFSSNRNESYNMPFTMVELKSALSKCSESAPGPDDITYSMIKHVPENTLSFILGLINRIFREHNFPKLWELAKFLPFVKPGKDSYIPGSYRPIALTSCLCKLMEKMVNARLMWYLERGNYFSPTQCGFRSMHSTTDVLVRMESSICEAFARKHHHITVFFDLEKAYDTTWRYGILKTLYECNLRGNLPLFIQAFLKTRYFQVQVGAVMSNIYTQEEGVPQGSVLSVTLFALAINGISKVIPSDIRSTLFVDDLSISFAASRMAVAERRLQLCIDGIVNWAERNGFKFSPGKTVAMHFCRIRGIHPDPDLYIHGRRISCVQETKFLGLVFDSRLTWLPHFKYLKARCMKAMDILKALTHTSWGADRTQMLRLYKALIFSKLTYGFEVYTSANTNTIKMLYSIHNAGIRIATGAFKSSPIESMLVDAGDMPLELHYQSLLVRSWCRFQRLPGSLVYKSIKDVSCWPFYDNHPNLPQPFAYRVNSVMTHIDLLNIDILPARLPVTPPWNFPIVKFCRYFSFIKSEVSDEVMRSIFLEHYATHSNSVDIFTDGSKSDAGVGFGVIFPSKERSGRLSSSASIFTAELHAILKAIKEVLILNERNFTIFCDSRSVLQVLENFNPMHPLVLEILEWLLIAKQRGKEVRFCWVPSHVGICGNERADLLAKSVVSQPEPRRCPLPFRDIYPIIRSKIKNSWQSEWENIQTNMKMRSLTSSINPWSYPCMPRRIETALCRLRIGHTRLTHGFLMTQNYPPYCDDCIVPLTVHHLIVECPSLGDLRHRFLSWGLVGNEYVLARVLGEDCETDKLCSFLKEAGILHDI